MKNKKAKKQAKHRSEQHKDQLTYFLDHPDIHREPCVGNGSAPGEMTGRFDNMKGSAAATGKPSIAAQIGFGGIKK